MAMNVNMITGMGLPQDGKSNGRLATGRRTSVNEFNNRIQRTEPQAAYELSYPQERMWLWDRIAPQSALYNVPFAMRLHGELNIDALQKSLNLIVQRHEVLRTTYALENGRPVQKVGAGAPVELLVHDVSLSSSDREAEAQNLANQEVRRPFDLSRDVMLRAALIRLSPLDCILVFTMHHVASDGWSLGVFLREFSEAYSAFASGQTPQLPELPIQYRDFALWQREWFDGQFPESLMSYWSERLANLPEIEHVMTDHRRPSKQSFDGTWERIVLSDELLSSLAELSQRRGVSLFMTFLAAYLTLLHRYSGQEDIVVGYPIANRNRLEIVEMIGYFANTLIFRDNLAGNPTFLELLARVRESALSSYQNQDLPFEKLIESLRAERDGSQTAFFQSFFIFQNTPMPTIRWPGIAVSRYDVDTATAKFDLTVFVEKHESYELAIEYNKQLFEPSTIKRMLGHYQALLEEIAARPEKRLGQLHLLTESERQQAAFEWNQTQEAYPASCVHTLLEEQVKRTPEAIAATFESQHVTFAELNRRANQVALHLQDLGVGSDAVVGLCVERSLDMLVGLLAILKAGGAYVPLDPSYPAERLRFMIEDAGVRILVTQRTVNTPAGARVTRVELDSLKQETAQRRSDRIESHAAPENLAYVIYTSGSTGKPKGVAIPHRAVVNLLCSMGKRPGLNASDVLVAVTTLSFDIAGLELLLPLCVGAKLVIASREVAADGQRLLALLKTSGATVMQATPVTWKMLLEAGWDGNPRLKVLCGGEAFPQDLANELLKRASSVWNMYGPTETTIWSAVEEVRPGKGPVPIGAPIANTQFYVLDAQGQLCPAGVAGELHIGGHGLARGYFRRPQLTDDKFVRNPFGRNDSERLYKTGDLVRRMANGKIEFLGRRDEQIKVRGYRIELGEIESALSKHRGIQSAAVAVRDDKSGEQQLVGYLVEKPRANVQLSDLRSYLRDHLPEYMVPSFFVKLEALPLTLNGKVNRRALPPPDWDKCEEEYVSPRTPSEKKLVEMWKEVLSLDRIGIRDNFFELGGHSLNAVRMLTLAEQFSGRKIHLSDLLGSPTIEQLAAFLDGRSSTRAMPLGGFQEDDVGISSRKKDSILYAGYTPELSRTH